MSGYEFADHDELGSVDEDTGPDGDEVPTLACGSVDEFVREHLMVLYTRVVGPRYQRRWAADWWNYPEAVSRLEALWRSWEAARLEPTAMSGWWRDDVDHHMSILMSTEGTFAASEDKNAPGEPLPYTPPPPSAFPNLRNT